MIIKRKRLKLPCVVVAVFLILLISCGLALGEGEVPTEPETLFPPAAPIEVTISAIGETMAVVSWTPVSEARGYSVWIDGLRYISSASASAKVEGLFPYTEYSINVTASNDAGESGVSATAEFKTLPPVPGKPEILNVEVSGPYALVTWYPLPDWQYIQSYKVYVDGELATEVGPLEGIQSAELNGLATGNHNICVSGVNENREGEFSSLYNFEAQDVAVPTGLTLTNVFTEAAWVSWDEQPGQQYGQQYKIYLDGQLVGLTPESRCSFKNLAPERVYKFEVSAVLPDGNQSLRSVLFFKTLIAPEHLSIEELLSTAYKYLAGLMPYNIALFCIGGAFVIARLGKFALVRRGYFRYL